MGWYGMVWGWDGIYGLRWSSFCCTTLFRFANLPLPLRPLNQGEEQVAEAAAQCVA